MKEIAIAGCAVALLGTSAGLTSQDGQAKPVQGKEQGRVKIILTSVFVDDQDKALAFYTKVLGFVKKQDFPVGKFKWLTLLSPEDPNGVELLLLEPNDNPAARTFQKAVFEQGIPVTTFGVDDLQQEYERLKKRGVVFRMKPTRTGPVTVTVFEDTCGNLVQLRAEVRRRDTRCKRPA